MDILTEINDGRNKGRRRPCQGTAANDHQFLRTEEQSTPMVDESPSPVPVPGPRPPWWLTLIVLGVETALLVVASRLVPEGTPLWQVGLLATSATVLILYGPEVLSKLLDAGSWFR